MALLNAAADETAIRALTAHFSDAVNRRAPVELAGLFTEDGVWVVPGVGRTTGRRAITTLLAELLQRFGFLVQTLHSGVVSIEGDTASARWYLSEFAKSAHDGGWHFVGVYQDRHVRVDGAWLFARRKFDFLYRGPADVSGKHYPFPELD
ncbi:MAG: nuclear transport factor 2 family protein [Acidimicrobiia bacterium]